MLLWTSVQTPSLCRWWSTERLPRGLTDTPSWRPLEAARHGSRWPYWHRGKTCNLQRWPQTPPLWDRETQTTRETEQQQHSSPIKAASWRLAPFLKDCPQIQNCIKPSSPRRSHWVYRALAPRAEGAAHAAAVNVCQQSRAPLCPASAACLGSSFPTFEEQRHKTQAPLLCGAQPTLQQHRITKAPHLIKIFALDFPSGGITPSQILLAVFPPLQKKSPTYLQTSMHMPPGYSQPPEIPAWLTLDHLACDSSHMHLAETFLETSKLWIHPSILVKPVMWKAFWKGKFKYTLHFTIILRKGKKITFLIHLCSYRATFLYLLML